MSAMASPLVFLSPGRLDWLDCLDCLDYLDCLDGLEGLEGQDVANAGGSVSTCCVDLYDN